MSEIADAIQEKCLAFGDWIIKLSDYLLEKAVNKHQPAAFLCQPSNRLQVMDELRNDAFKEIVKSLMK